MDSVNLEGKTVIVTGSNTGIGKSTANGMAKRGARVILACRNESKADAARKDIVAETGNENVEVRKLDLSSLKSVREFAQKFNQEESRLDILVCNAGMITEQRSVTEDGFETMFAVNHLGHFLLTNLLLDKLKACSPSRVVVLSSLGHKRNPVNFDDLQSEKSFDYMKVYGKSKSCNILFAVHLAKILKGTGVTTYSVHPGLVKTDFLEDHSYTKYCCKCFVFCCISCMMCMPMYSEDEGARTSMYCSLEPSIANDSGYYYSDSKRANPDRQAMDEETAEKLWNVSVQLSGL